MPDKTVYKLNLDLNQTDTKSRIVVRLPMDARIIHVGNQTGYDDVLTVWYECTPESPQRDFTFYIIGTGHPLKPELLHLGTHVGRTFVWHLYGERFS